MVKLKAWLKTFCQDTIWQSFCLSQNKSISSDSGRRVARATLRYGIRQFGWLKVFGLCGFLAATQQVSASTNEPGPGAELVFRSWGTEEGLPQNTVNAIVQTRDGYLWLGTRDGLARFDGMRFTVFGLREGLQSVEVQTLHEDRQGTLWIGTSGGGLSRLVAGQIENVPLPQRLADGEVVTSLSEDSAGRLWVGTRTGLGLYQNGSFATNDVLAGLGRAAIQALTPDRHGGMWIATATHGLLVLRDNQLTEIHGPPGNDRIRAYCLLEDGAGNFWASVGNGAVLCRSGGEWRRYNETNGLPFAYVTSLAEEADGTVWAGSLDDGLYRFHGGTFEAVRKEQGLVANDIRSVRSDREGNLWVGTRTGGLDRLSRRRLTTAGAAQGLTNDFTRSVAESPDGTLWVGTIGGGLYQGKDGKFVPSAQESPGLRYAFVFSVLASTDGSIWYGANHGLFHLRDGVMIGSYTNQPWVRAEGVTALCEDKAGGLWIGTSGSKVVHFKDDEFKEFPHRVARGPVTALASQKDGFVWVGSEAGGLKRLRLGNDTFNVLTNGLLSQAIRTLYLDGEETLWIGTTGGGLSRWRNGRMTSYTTRQGIGADTVSQIVEDNEGALWLGCNRGIFRARKSELNEVAAGKPGLLNVRSFGLNEGMPVEECSSGFSPAGLKLRSGILCFSTVKGLVFLDPAKQEAYTPPPNVLLEEVVVNGQLRNLASKTAPGTTEIAAAKNEGFPPHLSITSGGREVEFHYTAINFAAPEKLRFRYRLTGLDADWIEAGDRRAAYYHKFSAGDYTFQVMACSANGNWSEPQTMLAIYVQPLIYETVWFRGLIILAAFALLSGIVRMVERNRYRRRLALVETQHAVERERLRIAQDMHDHVGSILTQVSVLSDLGQSESEDRGAVKGHLARIGGQARAAVQALDEIVWVTNPRNDNLPQFTEYVCRFADECFEFTAVRCWQEVPTHLPNAPLRADVRHNVFLAIREAFNNVLKHSGATEVSLRLYLLETRVMFEIKDNGRGFVILEPGLGGNGLGNMKMRLKESGGKMVMVSEPGKGTTVQFFFPLSKAN